ncbi:MAG: aspartate--tRNA(Asn) ligase [Clostridia bacterium]|nr:aspartate--tRNA(Asn) ligase [Clostridia bacterium]
MKRSLIDSLKENKVSKISGFVDKVRDTRYMVFVMLRDTSSFIQVSLDKELNSNLIEDALKLTQGSVVSFEGVMKVNPNVKNGGKEFIPSKIEIVTIANPMPIDNEANIDSRLNYRWVDLRSEKNQLIFKVQSYFVNAMRSYLLDNDFVEIHTPKFIATASESGSEVFEVKYFDGKAYLAQSPQFYKQMAMAAGFEKYFEVAPCFRAEKSRTRKHATEFTSFDVEISFIDSYEDVMNLEAEMLTYALKKTKEKYGQKLEELYGITLNVPTLPFPMMRLADIYDELEKRYGFKVDDSEKTDLTTEAERLCEKLAKDKFNHEFLFVTDFPADKRAFYHMRQNGHLQGYDLIWKGIEITSGAQREHRLNELAKNAKEKGLTKDVEFYLEFFKYGMPAHGGFAIGVDRLTMILLNIPIKEAQFLFRGPDRLTP